MNTDQAYADRLQAQLRAADARLDELESAARARNAQSDMNQIAALRVQRDRVRERLDDARQRSPNDPQGVRSIVEDDWRTFRRSIADAQSRSAWDDARAKRFNAHLDEVDAAMRKSAAKDALVAADVRVNISETRDSVKEKLAAARKRLDAWRERREDEAAMKNLSSSELELDEAFDNYAWALESVTQRAARRAD